jgi:hypothetical protein
VELLQKKCERGAVRPRNDADYRRLRENELAHADDNGPASIAILPPPGLAASQPPKKATDAAKAARDERGKRGRYEVNEYADMLSIVRSELANGMAARSGTANTGVLASLHEHEVAETRCYQMRHVLPRNVEEFKTNLMFPCKLFARNRDALCALMQMSEYRACEITIDKFRSMYAEGRSMQKSFGEYARHFADECGMRMFCAYVSDAAEDALLAAFEMDGVRRYFAVMVFGVDRADGVASGSNVMAKARLWCEDALRTYRDSMQSTATAPLTFRPCEAYETDVNYWALYNLAMCKTLQHQKVSFMYAYYSACQCVSLK